MKIIVMATRVIIIDDVSKMFLEGVALSVGTRKRSYFVVTATSMRGQCNGRMVMNYWLYTTVMKVYMENLSME